MYAYSGTPVSFSRVRIPLVHTYTGHLVAKGPNTKMKYDMHTRLYVHTHKLSLYEQMNMLHIRMRVRVYTPHYIRERRVIGVESSLT
jgi:hypothetical protein